MKTYLLVNCLTYRCSWWSVQRFKYNFTKKFKLYLFTVPIIVIEFVGSNSATLILAETMLMNTVNSLSTTRVLITVCKLDKSNIKQSKRYLFGGEVYTLFELDSSNTNDSGYEARPDGKNIAHKNDVAALRKAVDLLGIEYGYARLDGVNRMVYPCSKEDLLYALSIVSSTRASYQAKV